jgi:hypothetical protein
MSGPRSLPSSTALAVAVLALATVLAPVAGLPVADGPAVPTDRSTGPVDRTDSTRSVPAADTLDPVVPDRNTTAYLVPAGAVQTARFGAAGFDVAGTISADDSRLHATYETTRLREAFTAAGNNRSRQRAVVERGAARIDAEISALETRADRALRRYNRGEISSRTYLRELAAIDAAAGSLRETVDLLSTYSSAAGSPISSRRVAAQKARLLPLEGPVRDRVLAAVRGDAQPVTVYVETDDEGGVVLAAIDRGPFSQRYIREASVPSARDPDGTDQFEAGGNRLDAVEARMEELYPWAWENQNGNSFLTFSGEPFLYNAGVYSVRIGHPHGTSRAYDLVTFLDGATGEVFREVQYKDPSAVPTEFAATNASEGLNVTVRRTRTGGPMLVTATNATTGEPVRAEVLVDGTAVGTTDLEGERWFVAPGPTATVTVVRGNASVTSVVFSDGAPSG